MKTQEEIDNEIKALEDLKDKVIPRSAFGDNHKEAIQAQIDTLSKKWDEDEIYAQFPEGESDMYQRNSALSALQWKTKGETEDGETELAEGWKELVRE